MGKVKKNKQSVASPNEETSPSSPISEGAKKKKLMNSPEENDSKNNIAIMNSAIKPNSKAKARRLRKKGLETVLKEKTLQPEMEPKSKEIKKISSLQVENEVIPNKVFIPKLSLSVNMEEIKVALNKEGITMIEDIVISARKQGKWSIVTFKDSSCAMDALKLSNKLKVGNQPVLIKPYFESLKNKKKRVKQKKLADEHKQEEMDVEQNGLSQEATQNTKADIKNLCKTVTSKEIESVFKKNNVEVKQIDIVQKENMNEAIVTFADVTSFKKAISLNKKLELKDQKLQISIHQEKKQKNQKASSTKKKQKKVPPQAAETTEDGTAKEVLSKTSETTSNKKGAKQEVPKKDVSQTSSKKSGAKEEAQNNTSRLTPSTKGTGKQAGNNKTKSETVGIGDTIGEKGVVQTPPTKNPPSQTPISKITPKQAPTNKGALKQPPTNKDQAKETPSSKNGLKQTNKTSKQNSKNTSPSEAPKSRKKSG